MYFGPGDHDEESNVGEKDKNISYSTINHSYYQLFLLTLLLILCRFLAASSAWFSANAFWGSWIASFDTGVVYSTPKL